MKNFLTILFAAIIIGCGGKSTKNQEEASIEAVSSPETSFLSDDKILEAPIVSLSHSARCSHEDDPMLYTTSNQPPEECIPDRYLLQEDACHTENSIFFKLNDGTSYCLSQNELERTLSVCQEIENVTGKLSGMCTVSLSVRQERLAAHKIASETDLVTDTNLTVAITDGPSTNLTNISLLLQGALALTNVCISDKVDCSCEADQWVPRQAIQSYALPQIEGLVAVYTKARRAPGMEESACLKSEIFVDRIPPQNTSVTIDATNTTLGSLEVSLNLAADDATMMYLTNSDSTCMTGGEWIPFQTYISSYTLAGSGGAQSVYASFKDAYGNITPVCLQASVALPARPVITDFQAPSLTQYVSHTVVLPVATDANNNLVTSCDILSSHLLKTVGDGLACTCSAGQCQLENVEGLSGYKGSDAYLTYKVTAGGLESLPATVHFSIVANIPVLNPVASVSGGDSTCVVNSEGEVRCFGLNNKGQLGRGDTIPIGKVDAAMNNLPLLNVGQGFVQKVEIDTGRGDRSACAMFQPGTMVYSGSDSVNGSSPNQNIRCWGLNEFGVLGLGHTTFVGAAPGEVGDALAPSSLGADRYAKDFSLLYSGFCAKLDNDTGRCWGHNYHQRLSPTGDDLDTLAEIDADGSPFGSLFNTNLPIAIGRKSLQWIDADGWLRFQSNAADSGGVEHQPPVGDLYTSVAAKVRETACAIRESGSLWCWGDGNKYATGQPGITAYENTPVQVDFGGLKVTKVEGGLEHFCAILENGALKCWGNSAHGRLGLGHSFDFPAAGDSLATHGTVNLGTGKTAKDVFLGPGKTCAILDDDTLKCWGSNDDGLLGILKFGNVGTDPSHMGDNLPVIDFGTTAKVVHVAVQSAMIAVFDDGTVRAWGSNNIIGDPNSALFLTGKLETKLIRGFTNTLVSNLPKIDLGMTPSDPDSTPTAIKVHQIASGSRHHCVITHLGDVSCWGDNQNGQLGINPTTATVWGNQPNQMGNNMVKVPLGAYYATAIAAGKSHSCALLNNNTVYCWGNNTQGQLGQDNAVSSYVPVMVKDLMSNPPAGRTHITHLYAAENSTCVTYNDGGMKCFGDNTSGRLGIDSDAVSIGTQSEDMANLIDVKLPHPIIDVSMNMDHTCAVIDDLGSHSAYCWGNNTDEQLGTGNTTSYGSASSPMANLSSVSLPGTVKTLHTYNQGSCFALIDGSVHCTGINIEGQKGGSTLSTAVNLGASQSFKSAGRFGKTPCGIRSDDTVVCWGYNSDGQAGQDMGYHVNEAGYMGDNFKVITNVSAAW